LSAKTNDTSVFFNSDELIDDTDDVIHDHINFIVQREVRTIPHGLGSEKIRDVTGIVETLQCALCMSVTVQPQFVKYCLHFFCKECMFQQINRNKKECPLCKIPMGTKREMRDYRKLEDIIRILRPLIDKHQASQEDEYKSIYTKQMQEQHEMR